MTEEDKNILVSRFLAWELPKSVCSDLCVTKRDYPNRSGTNLLTADEARAMIDYLFDIGYSHIFETGSQPAEKK